GPGRRQAARQEVLLPEAPRRTAAAHLVPPHLRAARALHVHRLPRVDQVPVRAVPQVAPGRAGLRGDRLPATLAGGPRAPAARGDRETTAAPWLQGPIQLPRLLRQLALLPAATPETPFCAGPDGNAEPIVVVARGAGHTTTGRVVEA